jgi:hypothetical protein
MEPIAVVSDSLARRLWPGSRAVGQRLRIREGEDPETAAGTDHVVVGVVRDVRLVDYDDGQVRTNLDRLDAYVPLMRGPGRFVFLYTHGFPDSPESLRLAIAALDREASIGSAVSLASQYQAARSGPRQLAWLLSGFAAFAAVLALLGVYSVIAYSVRQREREIGVRLVVGADRRTVTGLFIREGATLVACGLAGGAFGAAAIGYVLRSQLFGVAPIEPWLLAGTTVMFGLCAFVALWWPARRASLVDPSQVLKVD